MNDYYYLHDRTIYSFLKIRFFMGVIKIDDVRSESFHS